MVRVNRGRDRALVRLIRSYIYIYMCVCVLMNNPPASLLHPNQTQIVFGGRLQEGIMYNDLWMLELREEDEAGEGLMWCVLCDALLMKDRFRPFNKNGGLIPNFPTSFTTFLGQGRAEQRGPGQPAAALRAHLHGHQG